MNSQPVDTYENFKAIMKGQHLPLAFADLDLIDRNAEMLVKRSNGFPIRVASKSVRCVEIIKYVLDNHKGFQGVLAYSAGEAAYLAQQGLKDIVIAYPTVDQLDIKAALQEHGNGTYICFMVDHEDQLEVLNQIGAEQGKTVAVAIDIDLSSKFPFLYFGVQRSPIRCVSSALSLYEKIKEYSHLSLDGVMGYEAQIAGVPDADPKNKLRSFIIRVLKKLSFREVLGRRQSIVSALKEKGASLKFVNAGGTGSLELSSQDSSITELTAGSGLYGPTLFDHFENFKPLPAAGFAIPVTRKPEDGVFTCHGGGYIASGPCGPDRAPQVLFPSDAELFPLEGAGEVQTPLKTPRNLKLGDPVIFRHAKAGELCERFNDIKLVKQGQLAKIAKTYRGDGQCFL